jgi:hypothetical protein
VKIEEAYEKLKDDQFLCLEVFNTKFVAIVWYNHQNEMYVMNTRFGSGRHHTLAGLDKKQTISQWRELAEEDPDKAGANLVSKDGGTEVQVVQ